MYFQLLYCILSIHALTQSFSADSTLGKEWFIPTNISLLMHTGCDNRVVQVEKTVFALSRAKPCRGHHFMCG